MCCHQKTGAENGGRELSAPDVIGGRKTGAENGGRKRGPKTGAESSRPPVTAPDVTGGRKMGAENGGRNREPKKGAEINFASVLNFVSFLCFSAPVFGPQFKYDRTPLK